MPVGPFKAAFSNFQRRATACQLYTSPKNGDRVNSSTPFSFSWDPSCFSPAPQYVNIILTSSQGQVFRWEQVDAFPGSFDTQLDASWWGETPTIQLQVGITATDTPLFINPFSAGPVFTAINSNPSANPVSASTTSPAVSILGSGSSTRSSSTQTPAPTVLGGSVNVAHLRSQGGLTGGRLAVAVLLPILVAFAAIAGYVFYVRKREAFKRAAWVETIDKRMSRLSGDWQSMSAVGGGVRPSMQSNRARTPVASAHSRSMSLLGGVRPSISTEANRIASIYNTHATVPFSAEDLSQLGPRARALSEAAAAGRPLSTTISAHSDIPVPSMPVGRSRSNSTTADARPVFPRAPNSHTRPASTSSNNPYANAMAQRSSQAISMDGSAVTFPFSISPPPAPRHRLDSNGCSVDATSRVRVDSRVSFAEVSRDRRNPDAEKLGLRASAGNYSTGDEFGIDFGDAYPALAMMRVKSGEGLEGVAFPTDDSPLTPTREFLPLAKRNGYFDGTPNSTLGGRTPDEMLKAYAAAMGNEKEGGQEPSSSTGVVTSLKKFTGLWRK